MTLCRNNLLRHRGTQPLVRVLTKLCLRIFRGFFLCAESAKRTESAFDMRERERDDHRSIRIICTQFKPKRQRIASKRHKTKMNRRRTEFVVLLWPLLVLIMQNRFSSRFFYFIIFSWWICGMRWKMHFGMQLLIKKKEERYKSQLKILCAVSTLLHRVSKQTGLLTTFSFAQALFI